MESRPSDAWGVQSFRSNVYCTPQVKLADWRESMMSKCPRPRTKIARAASLSLLCAIGFTPVAVAAFAEGTAVAAETVIHDEFSAAFDTLAQEQTREAIARPGAVDIAEFEPPLEVDTDVSDLGVGIASYYGRRFAGRRTANGEVFNPDLLTAAHRTLPFGTKVRVTSKRTGRSVVVRINDRGPFHGKRVIDLSEAAARQIGLIQQGHGQVKLALIDG